MDTAGSTPQGAGEKHEPEEVDLDGGESTLPAEGEEGELMEVWLDVASGDRRIEIEQGETLIIPLASYSDEAYRWEVVDLDETILQEVEAGGAAPPPGGRMAPRGTGAQTFRFQARNAGQTEVTFVYRQPGAVQEEPLEELTVQVVVR